MLQFLIHRLRTATRTCPSAPELVSKDAHTALGRQMLSAGQRAVSPLAILDDHVTIGSARVMQFETQAELDEWLENEPYITEQRSNQSTFAGVVWAPCSNG